MAVTTSFNKKAPAMCTEVKKVDKVEFLATFPKSGVDCVHVQGAYAK